jgi:hypothetical protein
MANRICQLLYMGGQKSEEKRERRLRSRYLDGNPERGGESEMSGKTASRKARGIPVLAPLVRLDASMTDETITTRKVCECGCGQIFIPATKHHKFISDHRKRAWVNKNSGPIAISKIRKDHVAILARLERIEAKLGIGGQS